MKRKDFQVLAAIRLKEARILLDNACWEGAYYLAGYAAECALKACIAKQTERHDFPDKARVNASHTHNIAELINLAELKEMVAQAMEGDPHLKANWIVVRNWNETSRYAQPSQADAEALLNAAGDRRYGVLRWLKRHW